MKGLFLILFTATSAVAETVSVGSLLVGGQLSLGGSSSTIVDLSHPATGSGSTARILARSAGTPL